MSAPERIHAVVTRIGPAFTAARGDGKGGRVDAIVAGTNVTVDATDPANPIVSAVDGGAELPTELPIPVVPIADAATTDVPVQVLVRDDHGDPISGVFGLALATGGPVVRQYGTVLWPRDADGVPTGEQIYSGYGRTSAGQTRMLSVLAPGPRFSDLFSASTPKFEVGTPTDPSDAATKEYVDSIDAADIDFTGGTGLLHGVLYVGEALRQIEGITDRAKWPIALDDSPAFDTSPYEGVPTAVQPTLSTGTTPEPWRRFAILNPADSSKPWHWKCEPDGSWTPVSPPDTFNPPGNGYTVTLRNPGHPNDGAKWEWVDDDPDIDMPAGSYILPTTGRWIRYPTYAEVVALTTPTP